MRRRAKPARAEVEAKPSAAGESRKSEGSTVHDLEKQLAEALRGKAEALGQLQTRDRELAEAQEEQTATSEILRIISQSPTEVQPVFDAIVHSAAALCHAPDVIILIADRDALRIVASVGSVAASVRQSQLVQRGAVPLTRGTVSGRAVIDRCTVHVHDVSAMPDNEFPEGKVLQREYGGHGTTLAVPLLREGMSLAVITLLRNEVSPFTDRQVALLETFADQVVIAIENTRLFDETKEALERQTATSEILSVISRATTDVQPVLDAIVQSAVRLCDGVISAAFLVDGDHVDMAAHHNFTEAGLAAMRSQWPRRVTLDTITGRAILERQVVHIRDVETDDIPLTSLDVAKSVGYRSLVAVPMIREGQCIGSINVSRPTLPFSNKQIELLKTFAAQAVIAIENVRLFTELQERNRAMAESLEQQTATSEILRVISSSPTDAQPVFDAIVSSAVRLCGGVYGAVYRRYGNLVDCVAHYGLDPDEHEFVRRAFPRPVTAGKSHHFQRALLEGAVVSISDITAEPDVSSRTRDFYLRHGGRSVVLVPLLRESEVLGVLGVGHRQTAAFSESHLELLKTFADQAVIAIENVRLFKELQSSNRELTTALDQQTATSEILRVISQSPTDLRPVFDTIVRNAVQLCGATYGSAYRIDGDVIYLVAETNLSGAGWEQFRMTFPRPLRDGGVIRDVVESRRLLYLDNVDAYPFSQAARALFATNSTRSLLTVPMIRQGQVIGAFSLFHPDLSGFPDGRIGLVQTFADQAVIAIENVRLFNETKEALERQTATSEILGVISSSPTDVRPVFDTILDRATRLCGAEHAILYHFDGETFETVACRGLTAEEEARFRSAPIQPGPHSGLGRMLAESRAVQVGDLTDDAAYREGDPRRMRFVTVLGARSAMWVPLLKNGVVVGAMAIYRRETRPFLDAQVDLVATFADQAVIAIENVRLFTELQEKNRALTQAHAQVTESLEQQTATSEILRVISRSPTDIQPVLEAVAESAARLTATFDVAVFLRDGDGLRLAAHHGQIPVRSTVPLIREEVTGRAVMDGRTVHVVDLQSETVEYPEGSENARRLGLCSILSVPLLREGGIAVGTINLRRTEVRLFTERQIALLQTFADQAVIAIENVRLFKELQSSNRELTEALEQQTATSEILRVISRSQIAVQPVFDTIVASAVRLCRAHIGSVFQFDGAMLHLVAHHNFTSDMLNAIRSLHPRPPQRDMVSGRAILSRAVVQIEDVLADLEYHRDVAVATSWRSMVAVPMLREGEPIGAIVINRVEPGAFADNHLELLKTFADQAVIAIENVRLFTELQARTHELTRSVGQLTAIEVAAVSKDGLAEVSVSDTGVGIAPEDQEKVFEEFRQVGRRRRRRRGPAWA